VNEGPGYDPSSDALVAKVLPLREELIACFVVTKKPVLRKKYLDDCDEAKRFLPVSKFSDTI